MNNPLTVQLDLNGVWRLSLFIGMALFSLYFVSMHIKKIGFIFSALWAYVLLNALYLFEYPSVPYGDVNTAFMATAGQTFSECLLIPLVMIYMPKKHSEFLYRFYCLIISAEILLVWIRGYGIMLAPSFDTALIALFIPFAPVFLAIVSLITILTHHGSTALMILIAQFFPIALKNKRARIGMAIIVPALIAVAYFHTNTTWFDGLERINAYKRFMGFWWNQGWIPRLIGTGPGSFIWLSLLIDNFKPPMFLQMHSDWLQVTFELGLIGLLLIIATFLMAVKNAWENPRVLSALFGCAGFACTYHPLRFMPTMILVAYIFRYAIKKPE